MPIKLKMILTNKDLRQNNINKYKYNLRRSSKSLQSIKNQCQTTLIWAMKIISIYSVT